MSRYDSDTGMAQKVEAQFTGRSCEASVGSAPASCGETESVGQETETVNTVVAPDAAYGGAGCLAAVVSVREVQSDGAGAVGMEANESVGQVDAQFAGGRREASVDSAPASCGETESVGQETETVITVVAPDVAYGGAGYLTAVVSVREVQSAVSGVVGIEKTESEGQVQNAVTGVVGVGDTATVMGNSGSADSCTVDDFWCRAIHSSSSVLARGSLGPVSARRSFVRRSGRVLSGRGLALCCPCCGLDLVGGNGKHLWGLFGTGPGLSHGIRVWDTGRDFQQNMCKNWLGKQSR